MSITETIAALVSRQNLSEAEAFAAMTAIMSGRVTDAQIAALLIALRMKGETGEEIGGFARAIRARALPVKPPCPGLVDTCGTGGDGAHTFNISTTAALVVAACGVPVAKHGNRAISSKCGSADVLEALGVKIDLSPVAVAGCIAETGIGFLFAPTFHAAMKHAVRARKEVGLRTVFNLLGPLANPAGAAVQLMGVYAPHLTELLAGVLSGLGVAAALVVHGAGGLDEISTLGPSKVTEVRDGQIGTYEIDPAQLGLPRATAADLRGGSPVENAAITLRLLNGETGPRQDIVALNAAAALYAAGKAGDLAEGIKLAREAIRSGEALRKLTLLRQFTNSVDGEEAGAEGLSPSA